MHEYSIVQSLLESCKENAVANKANKITKVVVKIGVMSGIEIELLKSAFNTFKEGSICNDAQFIVNRQPIIIKCLKCQKESTLSKNEYQCPICNSVELNIIDGEGMYLMQLEMI